MTDSVAGNNALAPKAGETYRCESCELQVQIVKGCDCEPPCAEFRCCGATMKRVAPQ